jgi:hypothetical protein
MSNIINTGDTLEEGRQKINNIYNNLSLWTAGTGSYSVVANNSGNNVSIGSYSVVGGKNSKSNGSNSFIYGENLTGNNSSFLIGKNNNSVNQYNSLYGQNNISTTNYNVIYGYNNTVNDSESFCIGESNFVTSLGGANFIQGFNSTLNSEGSNIFGGLNNINDGLYSSIFCSPGSSLTLSADYSVILGGQNISANFPRTVYVPHLNIQTVTGNSSSSNVLVYNTTTKNVEKTNLPGSGFDSYRNWEQINGAPITRTLETNKSYIINESSTAVYTLQLPNNAEVGNSVRILSFMSTTSGVKIKVYPSGSDLIVLGAGFDFWTTSTLQTPNTYNDTKQFTLYKYETIEFTCINNASGNLKWVISNITTLQNFQKYDGVSDFAALLSDRFTP